MSGAGVGLREFGRELGISGEAIRKAIKTGRIPAAAVGTKELSSGRLVPVIVDTETARKAFKQNTDPLQQRSGASISAGKRAANGKPAKVPPVGRLMVPSGCVPGGDEVLDEDADGELPDDVPALMVSRAVTESYKAKTAKLEYLQKAGKLVDAEKFRVEFATLITTARNMILSVPSKAKGRIPHMTVDDIELFRVLLREALEEVGRSAGDGVLSAGP